MVMRFDPFRELDRISHDVWGGNGRRAAASANVMPIDAYRRGDRFLVHFDLPGVDPESVELTVEKNVLTVRAERAWTWDDDVELVVAERPQGSFTRQLFLSETLDADRIEANYDKGVLTVTIPVAEAAKPRKVQISQRNDKATAISAESH
jgi:HSP20 family protein